MKKLIFQKELILIKQVDQKMYALSLLYFEDIGYKFEPNVWNKCRDVLMTAYELKKHCNIKYKRC